MNPTKSRDLTTIIFSKNRASQLELLLRSLNIPATVLYTYDPDFKAGYDKVIEMYPSIKFIRETNFKKQLVKILKKGTGYVMFLVDDDVMIKPFWENSKEFSEFKNNPDILCLSLRLSPDYLWRGLPTLKNNKWKWKPYSRGSKKFIYRLRNWGCPMAVGAHIFRRDDVLPMIEKADEIKTPCFLEQVINVNIPNRPLVLCFDKAKFVNNEANQVQSDFPSHTLNISPLELEKRFIKGERLSLYNMIKASSKAWDYFVSVNYQFEGY